jgi:hypothetical protein
MLFECLLMVPFVALAAHVLFDRTAAILLALAILAISLLGFAS